MVAQNSSKVHYQTESQTTFANALKSLGFFTMLKWFGFTKLRGVSPKDVILGLLMQVFAFDTVNHRMTSDRGRCSANHCDNVVYDFLNNPKYNWFKLCTRLAAVIGGKMIKIDSKCSHKRCFIIDDTVLARPRSKKVELFCRLYDHVFHRYVKGFTHLMLAWTDGVSTIPVNYSIVSSVDDEKILCKANDKIDARTCGAHRRTECRKSKTQLTITLLKEALRQGIDASYVLMDTWFTNEPLIFKIKELGLEVIGMVKRGNQSYHYLGEGDKYLRTVTQLFELLPNKKKHGDIIGSVVVKTRYHKIDVKIVFLRHRSNDGQILNILSTDTSLSDEEIVALYARRFSIEGLFHTMKHFLRLNKENMGRSFDSTVAFSALSLIRTMTLEWIRRGSGDVCSVGGIFNDFKEEMFEAPFIEALRFMMDALNKDVPECFREQGVSEKKIQKAMEKIMCNLYSRLAQVKYVQRFLAEYGGSANDENAPTPTAQAVLAA